MILAILVILFILWLLGYGPYQVLALNVLKFNHKLINLWDIAIFLVLIWLIGNLPQPLKEITTVLFLIWILSSLGIIVISGLSNILIISLIVGILLYLVSKKP